MRASRAADDVVELPYTGLNPVIEREQMRGLFFEQEELAVLADRLPRGLRIVDVGANTGNHTRVLCRRSCKRKRDLPLEPLPRAVAAIRAAVQRNAARQRRSLAARDGDRRGAGHGLQRGPSMTAGLGATHFVRRSGRAMCRSRRWTSWSTGRSIFIKIDVEGMEMQALAGAARPIAAHHPALFVEVVDRSVCRVHGLGWTATAIASKSSFPTRRIAITFCLPDGRRRGRAAMTEDADAVRSAAFGRLVAASAALARRTSRTMWSRRSWRRRSRRANCRRLRSAFPQQPCRRQPSRARDKEPAATAARCASSAAAPRTPASW